jgi:hypothetical protein
MNNLTTIITNAIQIKEQYLNDMVKGYLECAQWTNEDLDNVDSIFENSTLKQAKNDCESFLTEIDNITSLEASQMGHDFWLTRNGHGAGFFDRTQELTETQIENFTKVAQTFKEVNIYLNNNKLLIE